ATNNKKRFAFDETGQRIRASQGHSVQVDLGYPPQTPPETLYHGTAQRFVSTILQEGLEKRQRHDVHLSTHLDTASQVGRRHGQLVILEVDSKAMHAAGHKFYQSENGVWLTEKVPPAYLRVKE
ncbi:MAG: RNA 2'-phosphotransferase, partial [Bacteroidota bacterium]